MFDMTRKSEEEFKAIKAEAVETERERKNGASGKLANVKALEVEGLISRIRNEYFHDDYPEYIRTGFTEFDDCIKGFRRGETYLLAARPEMGKTAFALSVLDNQIREGTNRILYVSLKDSRENILARLLKQMAGFEKYDDAAEAERRWQFMEEAGGKLAACGEKIFIDDRAGISVSEIAEDCEQMGSVDLIIVDYLQIVHEMGIDELTSHERLSLICEELGAIAKENNCAVLILSQLSRVVESRKDHRPTKEDVVKLVPERSVDNVIFLYRDDYYFRDSERKGLAEFCFGRGKSRSCNRW